MHTKINSIYLVVIVLFLSVLEIDDGDLKQNFSLLCFCSKLLLSLFKKHKEWRLQELDANILPTYLGTYTVVGMRNCLQSEATETLRNGFSETRDKSLIGK